MISNTTNSITPNFNGTFKVRFNKNCSPEFIENFKNCFKPFKCRHSTITVNNIKYDYFVCSNCADYNVANFISKNCNILRNKTFTYFPNASKVSETNKPDVLRFNTVSEMLDFVRNKRVTRSVARERDFNMAEKILAKYNIQKQNINMTYKKGLIKYKDENGLELFIVPQNYLGHTLVSYKPRNGYGDTIFRKFDSDLNVIDSYKEPDGIIRFRNERLQALKEYKSLIN